MWRYVLIPMWWGGFSEHPVNLGDALRIVRLNPHVVGRFFRDNTLLDVSDF